jgi:hypothetical protein
MDLDMIKEAKDKGWLNIREYNIAIGKYKRGQFPALSAEKSNELFRFFQLGKSLLDIHEFLEIDYAFIVATAIEYRWFDKREELSKDKTIKRAMAEFTNNIFLMNMALIERELKKKMKDDSYESDILKGYQVKSIKDLKELLEVTSKANEIQCMLSQSNGGVKILNSVTATSVGEKMLTAEENIVYLEAEEVSEAERIKQLEDEKTKRQK